MQYRSLNLYTYDCETFMRNGFRGIRFELFRDEPRVSVLLNMYLKCERSISPRICVLDPILSSSHEST